jgi:hypothetical protein
MTPINWENPDVQELWHAVDCGEQYMVEFLKRYVITPEQLEEIRSREYEVADLLTGRFRGTDEEWLEGLFADWNAKLGKKHFGYS